MFPKIPRMKWVTLKCHEKFKIPYKISKLNSYKLKKRKNVTISSVPLLEVVVRNCKKN